MLNLYFSPLNRFTNLHNSHRDAMDIPEAEKAKLLPAEINDSAFVDKYLTARNKLV